VSGVDVILLLVGGAVAGAINAMAGGGSALTVPLLVIAGVPGGAANGSNRVGILVSTFASLVSFRREGAWIDPRRVTWILVPAFVGAMLGAFGISQLTDDTFETVFGLLIIPIVLLTLLKRKPESHVAATWSTPVMVVVFFAIGIYAGAIQAGVGLLLVAALSRTGFDLVTANVIKVMFNFSATLIALPIFILADQVRWGPALVLAVGLSIGGWLGARFAVRGGERWIRIVMVAAAIVLAGRLLGFYG
jgi:uncharacterized membrane protein YfcA